MVKRFIIYLIKQYQKIPFKAHSRCKFIPTCSNYAIIVLNNWNIFKATYLIIKRIIRCNPFSKGGIDLPPLKENK